MSILESRLISALTENFERDPRGYITLSKETVDSSEARVTVAEMRNYGYLVEQERGVIRLTLRGYEYLRQHHLISA